MSVEDEPSEYERFKWNLLGDAVFEDCYGIWEAATLEAGTLWSPDDAREFAERALRELHDAGWIYFFRVPPSTDVNEALDDENLRLTPAEVDDVFRSEWWRGWEGESDDFAPIWFYSTPAGQAACENPPELIRKLWQPDEPR